MNRATDRKSLLALRGVARESQTKSLGFHGRRVTKVGPGSQTRARGLGAAEQGLREAHFRFEEFLDFFASPKELSVWRTREGFNKGRECTERQERRDWLRNACAAGRIL
jgi:hypothetical protein